MPRTRVATFGVCVDGGRILLSRYTSGTELSALPGLPRVPMVDAGLELLHRP
ncbi:hypothetical protein [Flindersiella endophytica]